MINKKVLKELLLKLKIFINKSIFLKNLLLILLAPFPSLLKKLKNIKPTLVFSSKQSQRIFLDIKAAIKKSSLR